MDRVQRALSDQVKQALGRVKRAKVRAPDTAILSWIQSVGADAILESTLKEIREVAGAF